MQCPSQTSSHEQRRVEKLLEQIAKKGSANQRRFWLDEFSANGHQGMGATAISANFIVSALNSKNRALGCPGVFVSNAPLDTAGIERRDVEFANRLRTG